MNIDSTAMSAAQAEVIKAMVFIPIIHTVTLTLNGATGGVDVIIDGFGRADATGEVTITRSIDR